MSTNLRNDKIAAFVNAQFCENCYIDLFISCYDVVDFPCELDILFLDTEAYGFSVEGAEEIAGKLGCAVVFCGAVLGKIIKHSSERYFFVTLPFNKNNFTKVLTAAKNSLNKCEKFINIQNGLEKHLILLDDIMYILADEKILSVYLKSGMIYKANGILSKFSERMNDSRFLMPANGVMLNIDYVRKKSDNEFIMVDGRKIPIRKYGKTKIVDKFYKYKYAKFKELTQKSIHNS